MQRWIRVVVIGLLVGSLSFGQAAACGRPGQCRQAGWTVRGVSPGCGWVSDSVAEPGCGSIVPGEWSADWHAMDGWTAVDAGAVMEHEAPCCAAGVADWNGDEVILHTAPGSEMAAQPAPAVTGEPTIAETLTAGDSIETVQERPAPAAVEPSPASPPTTVRHPESRLVESPQPPPAAVDPVDEPRHDAVDAAEPPSAPEPPAAPPVRGVPEEANLFDELIHEPATELDERVIDEAPPRAAPSGDDGARRSGRSGGPMSVASRPQEPLRLWTDASGRRAIVGTVVAVAGDAVEIRRAGGRILTVPIDGLSDVDRLYARAVGRRLATASTGQAAIR